VNKGVCSSRRHLFSFHEKLYKFVGGDKNKLTILSQIKQLTYVESFAYKIAF
jgi:hypothetical protein